MTQKTIDKPQASLAYPYTAALGLSLLILIAERGMRRRERDLIDANAKQRKLAEDALATAEQIDRERPGLPTDTLGILTMQGVLCPVGMDHPIGGKIEEECEGCVAWTTAARSEAWRKVVEAKPGEPPPPAPPASRD